MFNKNFIITFQPKNPLFYGKRRFSVGANSLFKYIGIINANKALLKALNSKDDKCIVRFRKYGSVTFYVK